MAWRVVFDDKEGKSQNVGAEFYVNFEI